MVKERLSGALTKRPDLAWRSLLVLPAEPEAFGPWLAAGADALILTAADTIAAAAAGAAASAERLGRLAAAIRGAPRPAAVLVAIPGLADEAGFEAALDAAMAARPEALLLTVCRSGRDIGHVGAKLAVREAEHDRAAGVTGLVAVAGADAAAALAMASYAGASRRLAGLAWDAAALGADLGLDAASDAAERSSPLLLVRGLTLLGARAAGVAAIDTAASCRGADFTAECRRARRDGFTGKLSRDPADVALINAVFGAGPEHGR